MHLIAVILATLFIVIGLWHLYWAAGGTLMKDAAIPTQDGKPKMQPPALMTAIVGIAILSFAVLTAIAIGWIKIGLSRTIIRWLCYGLATIFLLRAIGDFKYVGFTKRIKNSRFARLDTIVYSPLCLFFAIALFLITP